MNRDSVRRLLIPAIITGLAAWIGLAYFAGSVPAQSASPGTGLESPPIVLPAGVPAKVKTVLQYIDEHGKAPPRYVGGRVFTNDGRANEEVLPRQDADGFAVEYHEWDVNPRVPGKNRGTERLITGSDGSAYFTSNHYKTFIKIRGPEMATVAPPAVPLPQLAELPGPAKAKVNSVLAYIRVHGTPMPGYVGGQVYHNSGEGGGQVLPPIDADGASIVYHEWDVNPRVPGQNRGKERLVTGSDSSAYYTDDHYMTFKRIH